MFNRRVMRALVRLPSFSRRVLWQHLLYFIGGMGVVAGTSACVLANDAQWTELPALPDAEGFAGAFAGSHGDALLVAGGANFPDKMPWEGGEKRWYDTVYLLHPGINVWQVAGKLPRPLGYGVSLSTPDGVVCLGGSDQTRHYADCFRLQWTGRELRLKALPSLPMPCANFCGALVGQRIYVAGGLGAPSDTTAMRTFWMLDLAAQDPKWQTLESWPGEPRMLAVAAVVDETFYLCSGVNLRADADGRPERKYLQDAFAYRADRGWERIADLPWATAAAPSPAPSLAANQFSILGGDSGHHVGFRPQDKHPGFSQEILTYRTDVRSWGLSSNTRHPVVTTAAVSWREQFVVPSGEVRPGKRTPEVWSISFPTNRR